MVLMVFVSPNANMLDIIAKTGLLGAKPVRVPVELQHKLASATGPQLKNPQQYHCLVGRLIYLTLTRPELSYIVHILSQFMQTPPVAHWEAALRVVKYLKWVSCKTYTSSV